MMFFIADQKSNLYSKSSHSWKCLEQILIVLWNMHIKAFQGLTITKIHLGYPQSVETYWLIGSIWKHFSEKSYNAINTSPNPFLIEIITMIPKIILNWLEYSNSASKILLSILPKWNLHFTSSVSSEYLV